MTHAPQARAAAPATRGTRPLDVQAVRAEFPLLARTVHGKPLAYLDHAATTQKPLAVLEALDGYYRHHNANVHRAVHLLSAEATQAFDRARERVRAFLGAGDTREVIFVRGTTEAINVVAQGWLRPRLQPGDEILVSAMEHHSNLVPWQMVAASARATVRYIPYSDAGVLDLEALARLLGPRTRLLAVGHVSNALGTVHPVAEIVRMAHAHGVPVLVDGAQGAPHLMADVQALGCDFYAFSGHKTYGPTGIGVLWGRRERLEEVEPVQGGGDMIRTVTLEGSTWAELPARLEAGTPAIAGAIGLGAALEWLSAFDRDAVQAHEGAIAAYAAQRLAALPRTRLVGTAPHRVGVASFVVDGVHPHDLGTILDREGVAIRTGHHCAQPVMDRYGVPATARASFGITSTREEVDALCAAVEKAIRMFVR